MNIWDIVILLAVACIVILALRFIKNGKTKGCSCGCGGCSCDCCNESTKCSGNREKR